MRWPSFSAAAKACQRFPETGHSQAKFPIGPAFFAATGWSDQADQLAGFNAEVEVVERERAAGIHHGHIGEHGQRR